MIQSSRVRLFINDYAFVVLYLIFVILLQWRNKLLKDIFSFIILVKRITLEILYVVPVLLDLQKFSLSLIDLKEARK